VSSRAGARTGIPGATDVGVTATTIKIGHIGDSTGQARAFFGPQIDSINAYVADLNARGGIFGRRVQLVYYSASYQSPDQVLAASRRLVEQDKVFAVVSQSGLDNANAAAIPYYEEKGVPCIGCHSATRIGMDLGSYIFSARIDPVSHGTVLGAFIAKRLGKKRMGLGYCASAWSKQVAVSVKASFEKFGGTVLDERDIGNCDQQVMEPIVTAWYGSVPRPDVLLVADPVGMAEGAAASRRLGWDVQITGPGGMWQLVLDIGGSQTEGLIGTTEGFAPPGYRTPQMDHFRKVLKAYYPNRKEDLTTLRPWQKMSLFEEAARRAGTNLTRRGLIQALDGMRGWDDGLSPPVTFAPGHHWGHSATAFFRIRDGAFEKATPEDFLAPEDFE